MKLLLILLILNSIISCIDWIFLWLLVKCVKQRLGDAEEHNSLDTNNFTLYSSLFRYGIVAACPVLNILFIILFVTKFDEYVDVASNEMKGYMKDEN